MRLLLLGVVLLTLSACGPTYFGDAVPYPEACAVVRLDKARCAAVVLEARSRLRLAESDIAATDLLTEERCEADRSILCSLGGGGFHTVRFTRHDGSYEWTIVQCMIDVPRPWCQLPSPTS
jgi:hypothetical protein